MTIRYFYMQKIIYTHNDPIEPAGIAKAYLDKRGG